MNEKLVKREIIGDGDVCLLHKFPLKVDELLEVNYSANKKYNVVFMGNILG